MSIFDQYGDNFLPGDNQNRKITLDPDIYENMKNSSEETLNDKPQLIYWPFLIVVVFVFSLLCFKLLTLQIAQGKLNRYLAEGNRLRERQIPAPRGIIFDRSRNPIATNTASYSLELYPLEIPKAKNARQEYIQNLAQIVQISEQQINALIEKKGLLTADPIILQENLDRESALILQIKTVKIPGIIVAKKPIRQYEAVAGLSQAIGYVGKVTEADLKNNSNLSLSQEIGKDGIEMVYDNYLKGVPGRNIIEVDSKGRIQRQLSSDSPKLGNNVILSMDLGLSKAISEKMQDSFKRFNAKSGAAVALDPQTGQILSMISLPSYDNNEFAVGISQEKYQDLINDKNRPMFNRAVSGNYPSGSTIKPLVAAAGLEEGVINSSTKINDPIGGIVIGSWAFPDWKNHGVVDVRKAISESCNVFFYAIGGGWEKIKGLGPDKLKTYFEKFGLGKPTGVDLPSEAKGLIPDPKWKEKVKNESWYLGDTYHMAIGQGDVLATPIQMAEAVSSIANGGTLYKPYSIISVEDHSNKSLFQKEPEITGKVGVSAHNLQIVREGMRQSVQEGSSRLLSDLPVESAAKTGTAQFGNQDKTHAWMIAFAPYENPQIAIAVIVEGGGEGHAAAAPIVKEAFSYWFSR